MTTVLAYLLLGTITAVYLGAVRWAYRRTGSLTIPVGMFVLYFWTFMGAWPFMIDAATGFNGYRIGLSYYYLMEKMFPFEVNTNYILALVAYALFALGLIAGGWVLLRKRLPEEPTSRQPVAIDHRRFIGMGIVFMLIGVVLVIPQLIRAVQLDESFYLTVRKVEGGIATLMALVNSAAACCIVVGYAFFLVERMDGALFTSNGQRWAAWAYPLVLGLLGTYTAILGDRHIIFTFFILGLLIVLRGGRSALRQCVLLIALCGFALIFGGFIRAYSWSEISTLEKKETPNPDPYPYDLPCIAHIPAKKGPVLRVFEAIWSNEMFAAHFSMFGVLERDVPVEPLISFRYLAGSVVPSFLMERPPSAYDHYAKYARLEPGQGYTIHQATSWWINLGWFGLLLGGVFLGSVWAGLERGALKVVQRSPMVWIRPMLPLLFVAFLPLLVRSGIEGYKALLVEGMALPLFFILLATVNVKRSPSGPKG